MTSDNFRIGGPKGKRALRLIVDAGSVYTWVPGEVLRSIGIIRTVTIAFPTIEGRKVRRDVGEAVIEYDGAARHCVVVFGRTGDASVLGVTALENLALEVDPSSKKLRRSKALAAY